MQTDRQKNNKPVAHAHQINNSIGLTVGLFVLPINNGMRMVGLVLLFFSLLSEP